MTKERKRAIVADCLRRCRWTAAFYLVTAGVCFCIFTLYDLPMEAFLYSFCVVGVVGLVCLGTAIAAELYRGAQRERLEASILTGGSFPQSHSLCEQDYQRMLASLQTELQRCTGQALQERQQVQDYLTAWVHQIKTPISVLRMLSADCDAPRRQAVDCELFRMEQYVEMVLQYMRLGAVQKDLVIREYALDELIRQSIRKYAPQFILKKLSLQYDGTRRTVVTDQKWFSCILDQLLSNAVKYTPSGSVTIVVTEDGYLHVSDTGIGIAPEDLPCIFSKGYTGKNGRLEQHASGLGLYLAKQAAELLSIGLSVTSTPGAGTVFTLDLRQETLSGLPPGQTP